MRGYQKRIIYLKHTGSHLFDEAYFVVSPNGAAAKKDDMVIEANRIIEESIGAKDKEKKAFAPGFLLFITYRRVPDPERGGQPRRGRSAVLRGHRCHSWSRRRSYR